MPASEIRISGARAHNLRDVDCRVPLRALTVISGVSGSGKSSLAFDTLYAEGQRRYVVSLSTYARQFLERLPRPDVDAISHLPPAVAIEQRNGVTHARSTVGTGTEIVDHLRLLFARVGETRCPDCDRPVEAGTVQSVVDDLLRRWEGKRVSFGAPLPSGGTATALREDLLRQGWTRLLDPPAGVVEVAELSVRALSAARRRGALLLLDRLRLGHDVDRPRLAEAAAAAFARAGELVALAESGERASYHEGFACDGCGRRLPTPEPALFSFNSSLGACETCEGFGRIPALDPARVVPDPSRSLAGDAVAPFATRAGRALRRDLLRAARATGVPSDVPFSALTEAQRRWVFEGDQHEGGDWYGVRGYFDWLEGRRYKVQARVLIARYRRFDPCPACDGARLRPEALCVRVDGRDLGALCALTLDELDAWLGQLVLPASARARAARLLDALGQRVATAREVGLGYLSLARPLRTLSGGEAQRIQLATALGGALTSALYVLDEPSVGLHATDVGRLLGVLRRLRERGNTVVVVEHAPEIVAAADHVIELGPGAGSRGGRLVVEGPVDTVRRHPDSPTGRVLRGELRTALRPPRRPSGRLRVEGATEHNLQDLDVEIPLGQLVVVTGVSGAGKSTLVRSVVVGHLRGDPDRGACRRLRGAEAVREVVVVEPGGARQARSNPATATKAFEGIRRRFAASPEARARGLAAGWFSFNVPGGRCDVCEGSGETVVDMQFLEDVRVACEGCGGTRYKPEARSIRVAGRSIVDVLALSVEEALALFEADPAVAARLEPLVRVGLGYLGLGQPLSTLSGGEAQRLRLAQALVQGEGAGVLFALDEPTTGLHPVDVEVLLRCLDDLIAEGASVLAVEHSLEFMARADHVIDLGPGGGPLGGRLVDRGSPGELAERGRGPTGTALRGIL